MEERGERIIFAIVSAIAHDCQSPLWLMIANWPMDIGQANTPKMMRTSQEDHIESILLFATTTIPSQSISINQMYWFKHFVTVNSNTNSYCKYFGSSSLSRFNRHDWLLNLSLRYQFVTVEVYRDWNTQLCYN